MFLQSILRDRRLILIRLIILVLGLATWASADVLTVRQNLDKYWAYRSRLKTQFIVTGIGQGYSVPACWYNHEMHCINWGDGTLDLGWYIGSLATEHYMLSHPELFPGYSSGGTDLNQVRNELYWALCAMDRLDATAEACWDPQAPDTPGFFIRDDVPAGFYTHFPDMFTVWSDYTNPELTAKEMSQDQVVHVLAGMSLVKRLIPSDLVVNGKNLRQSAITRGSDIVDWVHEYGWMIKNPVTGIDVNRGPDARSFSTGFNKTCVFLTDGAIDFSGSISGFWAWVWSTLSSPTNPGYDNYNNRHMAMSLAATGNGWGDATLNDLMSLADAYDWYAYPMLYAILYDSIAQSRPTWAGHQATINATVQSQLNLAPPQGPFEPATPEEENTGWCADRKFIRNLDSQNHGGGGEGHHYPGLDYMLLHNLFYIVSPALWQDPSPPGQPANPNPATGATGVSAGNPTLSWTAGSGATSHDVYFGTTNPPAFRQNQAGTSYGAGSLSQDTLYYWRIDEKNIAGTTTGTVWNFRTAGTPPGSVTNFNGAGTNYRNSLTWTNPTSDFAGTKILFKTTGFPTSAGDGTTIYNGTSTSYIHTGITGGVTYYYAAFAYNAGLNYAAPATRSLACLSPYCYADDFTYPNGNLRGNGIWTSGNSTSEIQSWIGGTQVKINGGATAADCYGSIVSCGGVGSTIWVRIQAKRGSGTSTMWSFHIDDAAGNNLARWYGSGTTARGRIADSGNVTASQNLTSGGVWDNLDVKIYTATNQTEFFFNGASLGSLDHGFTGAGDTVGRLKFERIYNSTAGEYVYLDNCTISDVNPPPSVTNFTATPSDGQIALSWTNPTTGDYAGTKVVYKTGAYPSSVSDGAEVYNGTGTSANHTGLTNGTRYFYRAYTYDAFPNYSSGATATAIPADVTPPGPVTALSVVVGDQRNNLMWTNPSDPDLAGVKIMFKTTGYPTSVSDGTQCYLGISTSCVHTGLTNGVIYYYSAFTCDEVPNYSTMANSSGIPVHFTPKQAKFAANNTQLTVTSGVISASFANSFYAQALGTENNPVGIRIDKTSHGFGEGLLVTIKGTALTDPTNNEKYISAIWAQTGAAEPISPVTMSTRSIGGADFGYVQATGAGQKGMTAPLGPNNIGLLARLFGKVTQRQTTTPKYFYIDDGCGVMDGTTTGAKSNIGIRVIADPASYAEGAYVAVVGAVSCFDDGTGNLWPQVLPKTVGGIQEL